MTRRFPDTAVGDANRRWCRRILPALILAPFAAWPQASSDVTADPPAQKSTTTCEAKAPAKSTETIACAKIRQVLASPDFSAEETIRFPKLKHRPDEKPSDWMKSFEKFFRGLAEVLRAGVWVLAGIGILVLLATLHYWWRVAGQRIRSERVAVPTHVGGLDIRAESLPDDIAAAALARWQAGNAVACLSLLYRGALSSLVLRHAADIRSSSTESECLRAARPHVSADTLAYLRLLTDTWQRTVYASRRPDDATIAKLCGDFAGHFAASSDEVVANGAVVQPAAVRL